MLTARPIQAMSLYMDILVSARDGVARTQPPTSCFINEMPIELLAKIFLYTVQLYLHSKPSQRVGNLALVCKKWREVTDTFGELWSHIYLGRSTTPDLLRTHLIRSAGLPLFIQLAEGAGDDHWQVTEQTHRRDLARQGIVAPNPLFNILYQECHRWKAIYVEEHQTADMLRLVTHQADPLLSVQHIEVDMSFEDILDDFHRVILDKSARLQPANQGSEELWPNLRSIAISTPVYHLPVVESYFIRSSITNLTVQVANIQRGIPDRGEIKVWHWLRNMPLLENLRLLLTNNLSGCRAIIGECELDRHDHLRCIYLMGLIDTLEPLFPIINCASAQLEHLGIKISSINRRLDPIDINIKPLPHLKSLSIASPSVEKTRFMNFAALPKLQSLVIDHGRMTSVDNQGTRIVHQAFSHKPEEMLVHILERTLENAMNPLEDASSGTDYLRDLQLKSVFLNAKEEELITALATKIPQKLELLLKNCRFSADNILYNLQSVADVRTDEYSLVRDIDE